MCAHFTLSLGKKGAYEIYPQVFLNLKVDVLDVTLTKVAPALILKENQVVLAPLYFGFPSFNDTYLYNARNETVLEKETFKESFLTRRAVFPCTSFIEVDKKKKEHTFMPVENEFFYLAGFYKDKNFVLLTREPTPDIKNQHPRMPFLLEKEKIASYLNKTTSLADIQAYRQIEVKEKEEPNQQLSLF